MCVLIMFKRLTKGVLNRFNRFQLYQKNRVVLGMNKKLENTKTGKRCFILGTGPSIKDQNLLKLKNEYTFVVNNFWRHPQFKDIRPKFYVYTDPAGFQKGDKSNYWSEQFFSNTNKINDVTMTSFFNLGAKDVIEINNLFSSHNIRYLATNGFFNENLKFNIDISKVIPNTKNVIVACILIAVYMGFEEIYLLGCEHDFLSSPTNLEWSKHFYKTEDFNIKNPEDVKRYNLTVTSYESAINHAVKLFRNYRILKNKLVREKPNVKIYNATPNSFLDVFPFINFEDVNINNG